MKLGSLFDGIGGFPLAATRFGITPVWASEIEPFPQAVTKKHFPNMNHLGDITKINGAEIEPVDIITLGSPCQDLSIAGKRKGLDGERSGLFRTAINIVRQMRKSTGGEYPRFIVWENVPGAFSSNGGNDFRAVLEEITETEIPMPASGKWANAGMVRSNECEVAWRVLDAQYWGVPQRRKRIFLVADFEGQCAGEILFKPESLCGYSAESGSQGQRIAGSTENSIGETVVAIDHAITTGVNCTAQGPCVKENGPMWTLKASGAHAVCAICLNDQGGQSINVDYDVSPTLRSESHGNHPCVVSDPVYSMGHDERSASFTPNKTDPLTASDYKQPVIANVGYKVRRLTPTECERLQGLPDGYTLIDDKKCSDSARYKALGNGMAQPCPDFIMQGIAEVLNKKENVKQEE